MGWEDGDRRYQRVIAFPDRIGIVVAMFSKAYLLPCAVLFAFGFCGLENSQALFINNFADSDERFEDGTFTGYPGADPEPNPSFSYDYDFSGVGWRETLDDYRPNNREALHSVTMVSRNQFISATHTSGQVVGNQVTFVGANGMEYSYTVESIEVIQGAQGATDLYIGNLTEDVHSSITHYDIFSGSLLPTTELLVVGNQLSITTPINKVVGVQTPDAAYTNWYGNASVQGLNDTQWLVSTYYESDPDDKEAYFQGGDSGSPSFVVVEDELTIVGIHSLVVEDLEYPLMLGPDADYANFDGYVPAYASQIAAIVPEPTTAWLLAGAGSLLALRRRRTA